MSALQDALSTRLQPLRSWYAGLNARERRIVSIGGIAAALLLFFGGLVLPLHSAAQQAAQRVERKQQDLGWMRSVAGEVRAAAAAPAQTASTGSLITVVDQTAQQTGLGQALTSSRPSGTGGLQVRVDDAPFETVIRWLALLTGQHGIEVELASVDRSGKPGLVNATLVLRSRG